MKKTLFLLIFLISIEAFTQDIDNFTNLDPFTSFNNHALSLEEENFERFFSFGRFIHFAGYLSILSPIGGHSSIYTPGQGFGGNISYFIDWNIALMYDLSINFLPISIAVNSHGTDNEIYGTAYLTTTHAYLKYYFNFFDISKMLASLNPYLKLGLGLYILSDTIAINNTVENLKFSPARSQIVPGLVAGLGLEYDIYNKTFLLGFEALYHYTMFTSVNENIPNSSELKNLDYSGHIMSISLSLILNLN